MRMDWLARFGYAGPCGGSAAWLLPRIVRYFAGSVAPHGTGPHAY